MAVAHEPAPGPKRRYNRFVNNPVSRTTRFATHRSRFVAGQNMPLRLPRSVASLILLISRSAARSLSRRASRTPSGLS